MNKDTFCVLPWIHLATHPLGGSSLCCRSSHDNCLSWAKKPDGNLVLLDSSKLEEIYNSEKYIEVRQKMLNGERPVECEGCWNDEAAGIYSKREYENNRWKHLQLNPTAKIDKMDYRYIELRLGSTCNASCLTCNGFSSSKFKAQEAKIAEEVSWWKCSDAAPCNWFNDDAFYDNLLQHSDQVEEIWINGGEPTLIKAHYTYLKKLIDQGQAKKIKLAYSLNMTAIPADLLELWKHFRAIIVNASIDDVEDRNYYIRYPTKWQDVRKSLDLVNSLPNVVWYIEQTVSIFNVGNLHELCYFLQTNYGKAPHHNYVMDPDYLSVAALPPEYKYELIHKYKDKLPDNLYNDLINKFETAHDPNLLNKARDYIKAIDKIRNSNIGDYIPELKKIL